MQYDIAYGVSKIKTKTFAILAILGLLLGAGGLSMALQGSANAATTYTTFGDSAIVSGGNPGNAAQIRSVDGGGFGGVSFSSSTVATLNDLTNLATDTNYTENSCGGGAPRFQVRVSNDGGVTNKNIFVYLGTPPNYTLCPMNVWTPGTNLVTPASLVDTSQLPGGAFYDPYSSALTKYGTYAITGLSVVTDGEWAFPSGNQTVLVDNVQINGDVVTFEPAPTKEDCKKGGWATMTNPGPFKNQGDCVSYFATNGRNLPNGN